MRTIARTIERERVEILRLWTQGMGRVAFTRGLSPTEILGHMPQILSLLGRSDDAEDAPPRLTELQRAAIERHVSQRLHQGALLQEALTEVAILGRCIAQVVDPAFDPAGGHAHSKEVSHILAELHLTCVALQHIFEEYLLEEEQAERRYVRLLQDVTRGPGSIHHRLQAALVLIAEAAGGHSAAATLRDAKTYRIIVSASAGTAADELALFGDGREITSGRAPDDEREDPLELVPSDGLRAKDTRAVAAVRMPLRHGVRGVIYVASGVEDAFSAAELRRLESLADVLAAHVDVSRAEDAAKKRVEEVVLEAQRREQFVDCLIHDLTGPLMAAKAGTQRLLDEQKLAKGTGDGLLRVQQQLDHLEDMVAGLLDAHRIRTGQRLPMKIGECDLTVVAREAIEELRLAHGNRFLLEARGGVRGMWSADQLRRAIWNLAANGIEHGSPSSTVLIRIEAGTEGATIAVHNDGAELTREEQARLGNPFRGARGTSPGWGLGMTLIWGCAEAHGGKVQVESIPGRGTTFRMVLPYDARPYRER